MILNERQYIITNAQLRKFETSLAELTSYVPEADDLNRQLRHQVHIDALASQIESLREEMDEYVRLKQGNTQNLVFDSLERLPEALIKARIVRGLTQEQLAERLGLKAQQIQRYESTYYAGASLSKILEIQKALNIEIKEEVVFK
jgi:HTH-type transcriptional regulator / antitoxin HipB